MTKGSMALHLPYSLNQLGNQRAALQFVVRYICWADAHTNERSCLIRSLLQPQL